MNQPPENPPGSAAIRAEINETRQRMDNTIDALGERLKGRHLLDEALHFFRTQTQNGNMNKFKDTLTHSADAAARSVVNVVKTNPVPAALIGAGIAVYLYNRSHAAEGPRQINYRNYGYPETFEGDFGADDRLIVGGEGRLHEIGERVRDKAQQAAEGARELRDKVTDKSRQLLRENREFAASAIARHPLETGLMCLAVGLFAGIALPTSEKVRRQVGPQARALRGRARAMVAGGRQVIRSATEAARTEAEAQGLTIGSLKTSAAAVGRAAQDTAAETAQREGLLPPGPTTTPAGVA